MSAQITALEENKVDVSRDEAKQKIVTMANNVFKHADDIDRAGNANKTTAAAFNSAFVFYTILKQFGDRDEKIIEAAKYCMFKTTDILKALKEGRKPKPGPPGDEEDDELNAELAALGGGGGNEGGANMGGGMGGMGGMGGNDFGASSQSPSYNNVQPQPSPSQPSNPYGNNNYNNNNNGYGSPPSQPSQPSYQQPKQPSYQQPSQPTYSQPKVQPKAQPQPSYNNNNNQGGMYMVNNTPQYNYQKQVQLPQFENKVQACVEAEKTLKEAMAALRFEDVDTAIKKAEEAIAILRPHNH